MKPFSSIIVLYVVFSFRLRKGVTVAVVPFLFLPPFLGSLSSLSNVLIL
ncbi:hypothetical protein SAMN04488101_102481 [Pedobacter nyackensis]|uniref:Uncharacterized protein n=1 Tax=Pedobacter nyackensis TaxID=475255 RepID=A0A1W2BHS8_9SPHI|nr:hypothetical protein SAMN04488101_102481 [Pedobacter nyackensis]